MNTSEAAGPGNILSSGIKHCPNQPFCVVLLMLLAVCSFGAELLNAKALFTLEGTSSFGTF